MLHGFQEPTMPTGSELRLTALGILSMTHQQTTPMPDSPSERQESPAGHPNARLSLREAGVTSRQPQCWTPLTDQRRSQQLSRSDSPFRAEESPTMLTAPEALNFNHFKTNLHDLFLIKTKFCHLYMHLLISPP